MSSSPSPQTMEHFLACHQHAFEFFGGIPHKIMVDNLKSAVLKRTPVQPCVQSHLRGLCCPLWLYHCPAMWARGNEKAAENGVGCGKEFPRWPRDPRFQRLNPAATHWLETVANACTAKPGATDGVMAHRAAVVTPLPLHPFDIATVAQVRASRQFRVTVETNRYSVPAQYASHALTLKTYPDRLCIYLGDQLIARHTRHYDRFQDGRPGSPQTAPEQRKSPRSQGLHALALSLGRRPITSSWRSGASIRTITCAKSSL